MFTKVPVGGICLWRLCHQNTCGDLRHEEKGSESDRWEMEE